MVWVAFGLSLGLILFLARWNLWPALFAGALLLAFLTAPLSAFPGIFGRAVADPGVLALAAAAGLIPIIGGALQKSGLLRALVAKIPGGRATAYVVAPALFGLLPVPGGALFSAPILEELGGGQPEERAANVWFRHILLSFYPMSAALLTGAKLSGLDLWQIIPWQLLWALFALAIGGLFLLRPFFGPKAVSANPQGRGFWKALFILLSAPLLDLLFRRFLPLPALEVGTALALCVALFFALLLGPGFSSFPALLLESKPWRFALIVFGVFLYLGAFQASGLPKAVASLPLPLGPLVLGLGLLMGLATGRQQAALSVVIPVYLAGAGSLSPWQFSLFYQASYLGYLLSPLHPCLVVSAEYAGTRLSAVLRRLLLPSLVYLAPCSVFLLLV
jgi:integral membrane protein (TIGR00529 family)